ncbi:MAG: DNA polymerase III subunit delta' [Proteobacteria bacterium]|nr:DNA polymerase III subunit delta' [Pseudomonadota bacterium]MBU1648458.1 DNA polymerase III subunit delta' [Pseudomonadota bacterium]MBU1986851.1 DNA polymerase III subunit delta' [Pseudomonadota bacterium]
MGIRPEQLTPSFSRLVGQEKARTLLGRALESGQLAHAYLFRGPDGVGKQLFARSLAAAVNCRQRQGMDACGHCSSCRKYSSENHPDFLVISPEKGTIKIDRIREMTQALSYPPYESSVRVVLLEDIHTMRAEAANSLLKTLEEPPDNNLLILTAAAAREVLTTISSRCQVVPFFSLGQEETVQVLLREKPDLDHETAGLLARLSEGCPGQALLFFRSEMVALWREVVALVSDPQNDGNRDVGLLLQAAEKMAALKEDLLPLFGLLRIWLRDLLVADSLGQEKDNLQSTGEGPKGNNWKRWNSRHLFDKLQTIDRAEKELGRNCNRILVCEVLLFQLQQ